MTDVLITIDTEFSAGGYFDGRGSPVTDSAVYCRINGQSHGLGFILATLQRFGVKATFFVEAAHTLMLGVDAMWPAIDDIAEAGHDIQLHIHPMWRAGAPGNDNRGLAQDSMEQMTCDEAVELLEAGLEAFESWGLPRPIAFRAGNLQIGRATYHALEACDIPVSSSIGIAIHMPDNEELRLQNGVHRIGRTIEVPLFTYRDLAVAGRSHFKNLTVTGCGAGETASILETARSNGTDDIVVLTHPFEFIKRDGPAFNRIAVNRVNQQRLAQLCGIIAASDAFESRTFAEKCATWQDLAPMAGTSPMAPLAPVLGRIVENKLNDWFTRY